MVAPEVAQLATQLAELAARNAAGAVASKVSAIRARKLDQETQNELIELVNDLIADKNELIGLATAFEQELVAQRVSEADITYITSELLPVLERLAGLAGDDGESREAIDAIRGLATPEMLTILQLVGFNFRRAIGEPLTMLVERQILSQIPVPDKTVELQTLQLRQQVAYFEVLKDPEADC